MALLLITGCTLPKSTPNSVARNPIQTNLTLAKDIAESIKENKAVKESVVVVLNKDISVTIKITGLNRLRLKQIKKEVHDEIRQLVNKDHSIHISTDKRLFRDLKNVAKELEEAQGVASPKVQDQVEIINKDMVG